jgi:hypothetical protein
MIAAANGGAGGGNGPDFLFGLSPLDRKEFERRAAAAGMTLQEFIAEILRRELDKDENGNPPKIN